MKLFVNVEYLPPFIVTKELTLKVKSFHLSTEIQELGVHKPQHITLTGMEKSNISIIPWKQC